MIEDSDKKNTSQAEDDSGTPMSVFRNENEQKVPSKNTKQTISETEFLNEVLLDLVEFSPNQNLYEYLAEKIWQIAGNSYVLVNSYDKQKEEIRIRSYRGAKEGVTKVLELLGKDLRKLHFPSYKNIDILLSGKLSELDDPLFALTGGKLSRSIGNKIEKLINIKKKYTIGLTRRGELHGNILILQKNTSPPLNIPLLETFVKQFSVALHRWLMEKKLKESEERFRLAFNTIPDIVIISRLSDGKMVNVNEKFLEIGGFTKEEVIGKHSDEIQIWKHSKDRIKLIDLLKKHQQVKNFEIKFRLKSGEIREGLLSANVVHLNGVPHILSITRDFTENIKAEKTKSVLFNISERATRYGTLQELSKSIHDELSKVVDCENFYIALFNEEEDKYSFPYHVDRYDDISENELVSLHGSLTDYVRRTGKACLITEKEEKKLMETGEVGHVGEPAPVWCGAPLIDSSTGKVIGVVTIQNYENPDTYTKDDIDLLEYVARHIGSIIEKKKAENLLIENERKLRNFIDLSTIGIYCFKVKKPIDISIPDNELIDLFFDAVCVECNDSYAEMMGAEKKDIIGVSLNNLMPKNEENIAYFRELIKSKYRLSGGLSREINAKGEEKYFTNSLVATISNGKLYEAWGTQIDITERILAENELRKAKQKAEESDRLKTAFLANMSHEIRTPMNAILGFSELLSAPDISKADQEKFLLHITQNGDNLLKLIDDIIDISKMEVGEIKIAKTECSIIEIFDELMISFNEIKRKLNKDHIDLNIDDSSKDHYISIISDPFRIKQVMTNLISNALKYTNEGRVIFGCKLLDKDFISFSVRDTGLGIPEEKKSIIFDRFRQIDESHSKTSGGTGLGLAISKRIVELMGGEIWFESEEGKGSTFCFKIPFEKTEELSSFYEEPKKKSRYYWEGKKILVAEDIDESYFFLKKLLETTGLEIIRAKDGLEAVKTFRKNKDIALILMDIRMPEMDGFKATQLIKALKRDVPVLALTAYAMTEEYQKSYEAGCDDHITKPVKIDLLLSKMDKFLNS